MPDDRWKVKKEDGKKMAKMVGGLIIILAIGLGIAIFMRQPPEVPPEAARLGLEVSIERPLEVSPLMEIKSESIEALTEKALIKAEAPVDQLCLQGWAEAQMAEAQMAEAVEAMAERAEAMLERVGKTALISAGGNTFLVKALIETKADVNAGDGAALMKAVEEGHTDIAKVLIKAGADVNVKDEEGKTALMWAAYKGHTDMVKLLREHGAHE